MTRTIRRTIAFRRPFYLTGEDRLLPPGDYDVVTDEELIEGLSFSAYHRVSTAIFVPAPSGSAIEMVTIDPLDLEAALERDAASPPPRTNWASVRGGPRIEVGSEIKIRHRHAKKIYATPLIAPHLATRLRLSLMQRWSCWPT